MKNNELWKIEIARAAPYKLNIEIKQYEKTKFRKRLIKAILMYEFKKFAIVNKLPENPYIEGIVNPISSI